MNENDETRSFVPGKQLETSLEGDALLIGTIGIAPFSSYFYSSRDFREIFPPERKYFTILPKKRYFHERTSFFHKIFLLESPTY